PRDASFPEPDRDAALPLPALPPKPVAAEPAAPKRAMPRRAVGKVVKLLENEVVVSLGTEDGVERGAHIELPLDAPQPQSIDDEFELRDTLAVGVVTSATDHGARVRLGVNESVPLGAVAAPTLATATASLSAPPRAADLWQIQAMARPFAALS